MAFKIEIEKTVQENLFEKLKEAIIQGLYVATNIVHSQTVRNTPVLTGALKNNNEMRVDEEKAQGIVYNTLEYAPYVEYGQEMNPPHNPRNVGRIPFMRPALYENEDKIIAAIFKPLNKVLNSPWSGGKKTETLRT